MKQLVCFLLALGMGSFASAEEGENQLVEFEVNGDKSYLSVGFGDPKASRPDVAFTQYVNEDFTELKDYFSAGIHDPGEGLQIEFYAPKRCFETKMYARYLTVSGHEILFDAMCNSEGSFFLARSTQAKEFVLELFWNESVNVKVEGLDPVRNITFNTFDFRKAWLDKGGKKIK